MGNRGCVHEGTEIVRGWATKRWIICALEFRGWKAPKWEPRRWTALYFHDEHVALAAGHRPCALCRRAAYRAYLSAVGQARADDVDARLHGERLDGRRKRLHALPWIDVPVGAFVDLAGRPALVRRDVVVPWDSDAGYRTAIDRPTAGTATVITPPTNLEALRNGYAPLSG